MSSGDKSGGKVHRHVKKRKPIEKQWRKGESRWKYGGDGASDGDFLERKLVAPRAFHLANTEGERDAIVIQTGGAHTILLDGDAQLSGKPRRSTTSENGEATLVTIGDRVRYIRTGPDDAIITHVYERCSWLLRRSIRATDFAQVMVANIDMVIATAAASAELLRPGLIDRYLVAAAMGNLDACVVINKIDLPDVEDRQFVEEIADMYRDCGYETLLTSCVTGEGIDELAETTRGKLSAFSGHSGVGKTSLLNLLIPDLNEKIGELSEQSQRGIHTTSRSTLHALPDGGFLADTPGIREFALFRADPATLHTYYPDFMRVADDCRFPSCTHTHEPDCAVIAAVEREDIHPYRYRNYCQILENETPQSY